MHLRIGLPWLSLNEMLKWKTGRRLAWKKDFKSNASALIRESGMWTPEQSKLPIYRAKMVLARISPRALEKDNLYGGAKWVIDALKTEPIRVHGHIIAGERTWGLFHDDAPRWLTYEVVQHKPDSVLLEKCGTYIKIDWTFGAA